MWMRRVSSSKPMPARADSMGMRLVMCLGRRRTSFSLCPVGELDEGGPRHVQHAVADRGAPLFGLGVDPGRDLHRRARLGHPDGLSTGAADVDDRGAPLLVVPLALAEEQRQKRLVAWWEGDSSVDRGTG